jgi:hypothetical protein
MAAAALLALFVYLNFRRQGADLPSDEAVLVFSTIGGGWARKHPLCVSGRGLHIMHLRVGRARFLQLCFSDQSGGLGLSADPLGSERSAGD